MVQIRGWGKMAAEMEAAAGCKKMAVVKVEVNDSTAEGEEGEGPITKKSKLSSTYQQQYNLEDSAFRIPQQFNLLDEPSPLGLRLRKSPSLLDLIQMRLSQESDSKLSSQVKKEQGKGSAVSVATDKLKASNFPASLLRIGAWEYVSRYEGDLVAKCYFAKHKLVWEVLDGGLKNKIEIQWSDIMDIKARCPANGPATLNVVLGREPLFFRETNPQPRKHTMWQATSDFTGGEASMHRRHFLQCAQGLLLKHYEKLILCDPRLNFLSQQPEIVLESPYFESKASAVEDLDDSKCLGFKLKNEEGSVFYGFPDAVSPGALPSLKIGGKDPVSRPPGHFLGGTSRTSVVQSHMVEASRCNSTEEPKGLSLRNQIKERGLWPSMSVSDLMNHIENCISGAKTSTAPFRTSSEKESMGALDEIRQYLFSDSQITTASDEQSIMSRVNSLCCLLQKDNNRPPKSENDLVKSVDHKITDSTAEQEKGESSDVVNHKHGPSMSRKDSLGDILVNLPGIASFPQFLFNISDDFNSQAR